jgi:chromosome segregation ATPase
MLRALQRQAMQPRTTQIPSRPTASIVQDTNWDFSNVNTTDNGSLSQPDATSCNLGHQNEDIAHELQKVRRELRFKEDELKNMQDELKMLRQETEKRNADVQMEKQKVETKARHEIAKLTQELEDERRSSRATAQERDRLRADVQRNESELTKQSQLAASFQDLQRRYDQEKEDRKTEQQNHAEAVGDILKSKAEEVKVHNEAHKIRVTSLETENARLTKEINTLKAATASSSQSRIATSPVPSQSSSTDEEWRVDNIRKVYSKIRLQYDILHSAANSLVSCTRTMDLSSFGEFGKCMKKLKNALYSESGQAKRQNDEDGSATG